MRLEFVELLNQIFFVVPDPWPPIDSNILGLELNVLESHETWNDIDKLLVIGRHVIVVEYTQQFLENHEVTFQYSEEGPGKFSWQPKPLENSGMD